MIEEATKIIKVENDTKIEVSYYVKKKKKSILNVSKTRRWKLDIS